MDIDSIEEISAATVSFERELEHLVLETFAHGVTVEKTWLITTPLAETPDWSVTIEKVGPAKAPDDTVRDFEE